MLSPCYSLTQSSAAPESRLASMRLPRTVAHRGGGFPQGATVKYHLLIGKRFARLTVLRRFGITKYSCSIMECRCDCGNVVNRKASSLIMGKTNSCGCLWLENLRIVLVKHGAKHTPEYNIWRAMKQRCLNPNNKAFKNYGGRGITICENWKNSFSLFIKDIGLRPSAKHSIERINNDGNYELSNCKWATREEQDCNKRTNRIVTFLGKSQPLSAWCRELGVKRELVQYRIDKLGWTTEMAFTQAVSRAAKTPLS